MSFSCVLSQEKFFSVFRGGRVVRSYVFFTQLVAQQTLIFLPTIFSLLIALLNLGSLRLPRVPGSGPPSPLLLPSQPASPQTPAGSE